MILETYFKHENGNYEAILDTKSSYMHISTFTLFKLLATQGIKT